MFRLPLVVIVLTLAAFGTVVLGASQGARAAAGGAVACVPTWTDVAGPRTREGQLYSIVALSSTDAWAVGGIIRYDGDWNTVSAKPLVVRLDGRRWNVAPSPVNVGNLYGVAATPDGDVWAVGWTGRTVSKRSPLVVRWSGGAWSTVSVPASLPIPVGVAAAGPRDVWIVGASRVGSTDYAEAWRFDGVRWQRSLHAKGAHVNAVVAVSENDVWAVGSSGIDRAAAFHWDGAKWASYVRPAQHNYDRASLLAVAAVVAGDVWAGFRAPRGVSLECGVADRAEVERTTLGLDAGAGGGVRDRRTRGAAVGEGARRRHERRRLLGSERRGRVHCDMVRHPLADECSERGAGPLRRRGRTKR